MEIKKKDNLCKKCLEFYGSKENLCSVCYSEAYPHAKKVVAPEVKENDLLIHVENYKKKYHLNHKLLDNKQFVMLKKQCENKSSNEIYLILNGFYDFPKIILYARQADELLTMIYKVLIIRDDIIDYIHAICKHVIDPWNLTFDNSVLECYYKDLGQLTKCPTKIKDLEKHFFFGSVYMSKYANIVIKTCTYCSKDIRTSQNIIKCKNCNFILHTHCYFSLTLKNKCKYDCTNCNKEISSSDFTKSYDIYK